MEISVIIINFKSRGLLDGCLASVEKLLSQEKLANSCEVIVFNNDKQRLKINKEKLSFELKTINYGKNIGYGKANNLAAQEARGKILFFLNPDTRLTKGSVRKILKCFHKDSSLGAMGLKIIEKKRHQPQPWTSGKKTSLWNILFRNTFNKPWNKNKATSVDWVSGTALLVKRSLFEKLNGFDEKFFMYFEDQDLCLRIKKAGYKNIFYPYLQVLHYDGQSWKNNARKKKNYYYQSQEYFFEKHQAAWQGFLLKKMRNILKFFK